MENNRQTTRNTVNTELTSTQINAVEDMVVVPSSSQAEDTSSMATSEVTNNIQTPLIINGAGMNLERPRVILVANSIIRHSCPQLVHIINPNPHVHIGEDDVNNTFYRRCIELKYELLKRKLNLLKLKRDGLAKQFDTRMKLLKTRIYFEKKKLYIFRKKYRC
ncbi:uncharacterized protein LOC130899380 [Diorhabda carinulata]|uniref:uncharacterized protein LOC130899380 n=1 Tax=Diorhabda carinulata TaxID=1163345 RepID=UPI0025A1BD59|nr:uncharacterized protein LOC130899380 [Diorhabda carinulata]XP_057665273.1 uncharacterized protein LOC130899380 [Diorhabda carinulata]XP_057665274.1 uncharacterized protein LOC130899380 [Diorhabda carinulata]